MSPRVIAIALLVGLAATSAGAADAPLHHALTVTLDPATRVLRVVDRITLRAGAPASFTLAPGLRIERLVVDGAAKPAEPRPRVELALTGRPTHEVIVEYGGTLEAVRRDADLSRAMAGPEATVLPGAGWYPEFGAPFTYEVSFDVPDPQRAVTSGRLTAEVVEDGRYRVGFAGDDPIDELTAFAGPYRIAERIHRGWRLRTYFDASVADLSGTYLDHLVEYLDLYDGWIGTYPYAGFAVVTGPFPVGLGFPGLTYLGTGVVRLPFIPTTSLGHEVLHSWWGAGVRPASDGNWAEGLTTFMADYTLRERRDAAAARQERLAWLREFAVLPAAQDRPLAEFRGRTHVASQATGYHKAAFVFEMLRDEIGANAFASGVRRFWREYRFKSAGWTDLAAAFAEAANMPLDGFFAQWIRRAGAPELGVRDVRHDGRQVTFTLTQTEPTYALAVPVVVETTGKPTRRTVRFSGTSAGYALEVADPPRALLVDPDLQVFRRLAPEEIPPIIRSVAFDQRATTVIAAGDAAGRAAARAVAAALFERAPTLADAGVALPAAPTLVAGTTADVSALLARAGVGAPPAALPDRGTARVWATRRGDGAPLVVVAGRDAEALQRVAGPLPHLGGQSWIVFEGARAVERGLWQPPTSPLRVVLDEPTAADVTRNPR